MMPWKLALAAAAACILVTACAGAPHREGGGPGRPSAASADDLRQIDAAEQGIRNGEAELAARQAQAAPEPQSEASCARACLLQQNICALAERICAIAASYPPDDPVTARCVDARARCGRARQAVASRCTCT
jgi:hypothetical protein